MEREEAIQWLKQNIPCIPRTAKSVDGQIFLEKNSRIVEDYFNKKPLEEILGNYSTAKQGFVREIYKRLEHLKLDASKLIASSSGKGYADLKDDYIFAEVLINYCINSDNKLTKNLLSYLEADEKEIGSLLSKTQREKDGQKVRARLEKIGSDPRTYVFIWEHLLNNNSN